MELPPSQTMIKFVTRQCAAPESCGLGVAAWYPLPAEWFNALCRKIQPPLTPTGGRTTRSGNNSCSRADRGIKSAMAACLVLGADAERSAFTERRHALHR